MISLTITPNSSWIRNTSGIVLLHMSSNPGVKTIEIKTDEDTSNAIARHLHKVIKDLRENDTQLDVKMETWVEDTPSGRLFNMKMGDLDVSAKVLEIIEG